MNEINKTAIALLILAIILVLPETVSARKGVGIAWDTETEIVSEGAQHCVQYGLYNPWEEDVVALLSVSGGLKDVIVSQESEKKLVPVGTRHDDPVKIEFCFEVAEVYDKTCVIGPLLCEQTCSQNEVIYQGKVVVMEEPSADAGGTAGSATAMGVSVPLRLKVRCVPHDADATLFYAVVLIIALIAIFLIVRNRKRY